MKKLLALTLALALVFAIAGCSTNAQQSAQQNAQPDIADVTETVVAIETQAPTAEETVAPVTEAQKEEQISEKEAKSIALKHAGFKEDEVTHLFVELDYDDGVLRYEVDFHKDLVEYDYDIDAKTGKILSYDKDYDD